MATFDEAILNIGRAVDNLDLTPILEKCADVISRETAENFEQSKKPDGTAYEPLKPSTLNSRVRNLQGQKGPKRKTFGTRPLLVYGVLKEAATGKKPLGGIREIQGNTLTYGVEVNTIPYARKQQMGDPPTPPRPYLGLTDEIIDEMEDIAVADILRQLGG